MKKSEFKKNRASTWARVLERGYPSYESAEVLVDRDVVAAEAAGVAWEPEGGPVQGQAPVPEPVRLPERITAWPGDPGYIVPKGRPWLNAEERERGVAEAVRRYNEWPDLESRWRRTSEAWEDGVRRAEKAEAEVKRLGGVIDEYSKADTKLRADLAAALGLAATRLVSLRKQEAMTAGQVHRAAAADEALAISLKQNRLLAAERDALKLAVQEGETEVGRLQGELRESRALYDFSLEQRDHLRRHASLVQGFLSDDKETFKRSLRELLRLAAQADGEEVPDGE